MTHFTKLNEYFDYLGWPPPEHPMFAVMNLASDAFQHSKLRTTSPPISSDFYVIKVMRLLEGDVTYGRTKYDFSHGSMKFVAPGQIVEWKNIVADPWGFAVVFHKDYVRGYDIDTRIKKYGFFSYSTNEALHLSPREEQIALNIFQAIEAEYETNPDEFSKEIILSHLDTLLKYSDRFYKRQFQDRKPLTSDLSERFHNLLMNYFESGEFEENGTPTIDWIAGELSLSPRYLSDSLKAATGKTALEHIHLFLIDEAKSLLLAPGATVSDTAYRLGFEYPQYFSRLFKKKTGQTPKEYQNEHLTQ